jgi:hypothetical protein
LRRVSAVGFDSHQPITSPPWVYWPSHWHKVVCQRICGARHWRDRPNSRAVPPVDATSWLCPVSKMYC